MFALFSWLNLDPTGVICQVPGPCPNLNPALNPNLGWIDYDYDYEPGLGHYQSPTRGRARHSVRAVGMNQNALVGQPTAGRGLPTLPNQKRLTKANDRHRVGFRQAGCSAIMRAAHCWDSIQNMKSILILTLAFVTYSALALEDTIANRETQADRYLAAQPVKEVLAKIIEPLMDNNSPPVPKDKRKEVRELLFKYCDWDAITSEMKNAMIKIYTADELKALADFYGSPAGQSAVAKSGAYFSEVAPDFKLEIAKAMAKEKLAQLNTK
jgi:hypothetical protein